MGKGLLRPSLQTCTGYKSLGGIFWLQSLFFKFSPSFSGATGGTRGARGESCGSASDVLGTGLGTGLCCFWPSRRPQFSGMPDCATVPLSGCGDDVWPGYFGAHHRKRKLPRIRALCVDLWDFLRWLSLFAENVHLRTCTGKKFCSNLGLCSMLPGHPYRPWGAHFR